MGCGNSSSQVIPIKVQSERPTGRLPNLNQHKNYELAPQLLKKKSLDDLSEQKTNNQFENAQNFNEESKPQHLVIENLEDMDEEPEPEEAFEEIKKWKIEARKVKNELKKLGTDSLYEDNQFKYFSRPPNDKMEENANDIDTEISWLRPHELVATPVLGLHHTKPDDVKQGNLGDCWLIASFGAVAKHPLLLKAIFPGEQTLYGPRYKGYIKGCFWIYGERVEIYVDDRLPTRHNNLIYGQCKISSNFWVPLLEKLYAKLVGSYENLTGGHSVRAITDLTGSMCVTFNPGSINLLPLRYRIEDEWTKRNQLVGCAAIRFAKSDQSNQDDFDGHAYTILAINKVLFADGTQQRIYTLRNPHGIAKEYHRLTSKNEIWSKIDETSKEKIMFDGKEILSWMNANHIKSYFHNLTIAYVIPQLNENFKIFEFKNKWKGPFNNEVTAKKYLRFQHYLLHVKHAKSNTDSGKLDIVVNLIQEEKKKNENLGISTVLFPVRQSVLIGEGQKIGTVDFENIQSKTFLCSRQCDEILMLDAGYYVLTPSISDMKYDIHKFLFRVFSYHDINVEELYLDSDNLWKFHTKDNRKINILLLTCAFCDKLIEGKYTTYKNSNYHKECYEKFNVCDCCSKPFEGSFYKMDNGMHYCVPCYQAYDARIKSANLKFS